MVAKEGAANVTEPPDENQAVSPRWQLAAEVDGPRIGIHAREQGIPQQGDHDFYPRPELPPILLPGDGSRFFSKETDHGLCSLFLFGPRGKKAFWLA
jgi:hypothetical protein